MNKHGNARDPFGNAHFEPAITGLAGAAPGRESDEFDALADLFLGEGEREAPGEGRSSPGNVRDPAPLPLRLVRDAEAVPPGSEPPQRAVRRRERGPLELLVMGHLPVRSAPWASQYARAVAEQKHSPVVHLRLAGDAIAIGVIGDASRVSAPALTFDEALRSVQELIAGGASLLVQADEPDECDLLLSRCADFDAITLLAGASESAIVAAYRTIKSLALALSSEDAAASAPPTHPPSVCIAVMGGSTERAHALTEKLRKSAKTFLDLDVAAGPHVDRIAPTRAIPLFHGEISLNIQEILARLRVPGAGSRPAPAHEQAPPRVASRSPEEPKPKVPVDPDDPNPATLAHLLHNLTPLPVQFPDDPSIELAVDDSGTLRLLRRDDDGKGIEKLTAAGAWAKRHASLIAGACAATCAVDTEAQPVLHLFTSAPRNVIPLLSTPIRVHLIAPIEAVARSGRHAWFSIELN